MISLPIPFVVALLLVVLTLSNHEQLSESATGKLFAVLLYLHAASMVLVGLRWTNDWVMVLPAVATLAVLTSALLYLAFCSLGRGGPVIVPARDWVHLIPIALVAFSALFFFRWVDLFLMTSKCLYAGLLIQLAQKMPDSLQLVRLSWLHNTQKALWIAAAFLILTVLLDLLIALDFALYEGRHAPNMVGFVSMGILLLLTWASVAASRGQVTEAVDEPKSSTPATNQQEPEIETDTALLLESLNRLLINDRLYADTNLNLQRLAKKAGVPARIVSKAVNIHTGQNISQWVNNARIEAACNLLKNPEVSVNEAMLDAGFLTKSNFHREFNRVKGCSPSEWRAREFA